jgi:hypothetical protein
LLKLGVQSKLFDEKLLLYYETFDILKYCHAVYVQEHIIIFSFTKLTVLKILAILLILI